MVKRNLLPGDRLRLIRSHKKMAQREVAEGICSIAYLSKIENNIVSPNETLFQELAERLGIEADLLLQTPKGYSDRLEQISNDFWEKESLSDHDAVFLAILVNNVDDPSDSLRVFSVLLKYYLDRREWDKAKEIYAISKNVLPELPGDAFYPNAFHYYLSCGHLKAQDQQYTESYQYYSHLEKSMEKYSEYYQARLQYSISRVLQNMLEEKSLALVYSERAYRYFEKTNDTKMLIWVMMARGMQFWMIGEYEKSLEWLFQAQAKLDEAGITNQTGIIKYNVGRVYQLQKRYDEAIVQYKECLELETDNWEARVYTLKRLAEIYFDCKQWELVDDSLGEGLDLATRLEMQHDQVELRAIQCRLYLSRFDVYKYEREMKKLIQWCTDKEQYKYIKSLSTELGNYFLTINSYKQSATYFKIAHDAENQITAIKAKIKV